MDSGMVGTGITASAACVGACYLVSYVRAQVRPVHTAPAREAVAALRKATAAKDGERIQRQLRMLGELCRDVPGEPGLGDDMKMQIASQLDAVIDVLKQKGEKDERNFTHDLECVLVAVSFITRIAMKSGGGGGMYGQPQEPQSLDEGVVAGLVAADGVKALYRTMSRAYHWADRSAQDPGKENLYREIVSEAADALDKITTVGDKVTMDFDVPASAKAAEQLAGLKVLPSVLYLINDDQRPDWQVQKRVMQKVLGLLKNVTTIRKGAQALAGNLPGRREGDATPAPLQRFLELATQDASVSRAMSADQACASSCVMHMLRYVPECREQLFPASADAESDLSASFIDFIDCARIGQPPDVHEKGKHHARQPEVTFAALQSLEYMIDKCDIDKVSNLLMWKNQWGLLAIYGIVARYRINSGPMQRVPQRVQRVAWHVRQKCRQVAQKLQQKSPPQSQLQEMLKQVRKHNGEVHAGAKVWGTKFRVFDEIQKAEVDDAKLEKDLHKNMQKQQMQQQMFQQMMMAQQMGGGEMDEEQMEMMQMQMQMMGMGGGGGGMPPGFEG